MRFIHLKENEKQELESLYKTSNNADIRERSQCLLLSSNGIKIVELMKIFSITRATVYNWFDKWESTGFLSLNHQKGQGRKLKLQEIPDEELIKILKKHPQNLSLVLIHLQNHYSINCHRATLKRHLFKIKAIV